MDATYELYLTDDRGRRIALLRDIAFFSYSRRVSGMGTFQVGIPYQSFVEQVFPVFQPDRRVEVWRSPAFGLPMRLEGMFLLRRPNIYTRLTDNMQMIVLYGRDPKELLRRRWIIQPAGYPQTLKNEPIDDMMKAIVREQCLYGECLDVDAVLDNDRAFPENEFSVQADVSLGPTYAHTFADRNVLDTIIELHEASLQLNNDNPLFNAKIYYDIIPSNTILRVTYILAEDGTAILAEDGTGILEETSASANETLLGFQFVTFANLRGQDRTDGGLVFSVENGNLESPNYSLDHFEEVNVAIVKGFGRGDSRQVDTVTVPNRVNASRWNRCEMVVDASTEPEQDRLADYAYPELHKRAPREEIDCVFLNTPGGEDAPRSLYGVDWDLGDLLPVQYAGKEFDVELDVVYVGVNEEGQESISGRNRIEGSNE
jgi:hypothetical protein